MVRSSRSSSTRAGPRTGAGFATAPVDPARVVAVEDSTAGVAAALGASLRVVAVAHTYSADVLRATGAHRVFDRIADVGVEGVAGAVIGR